MMIPFLLLPPEKQKELHDNTLLMDYEILRKLSSIPNRTVEKGLANITAMPVANHSEGRRSKDKVLLVIINRN
jgi:hypothetical protein